MAWNFALATHRPARPEPIQLSYGPNGLDIDQIIGPKIQVTETSRIIKLLGELLVKAMTDRFCEHRQIEMPGQIVKQESQYLWHGNHWRRFLGHIAGAYERMTDELQHGAFSKKKLDNVHAYVAHLHDKFDEAYSLMRERLAELPYPASFAQARNNCVLHEDWHQMSTMLGRRCRDFEWTAFALALCYERIDKARRDCEQTVRTFYGDNCFEDLTALDPDALARCMSLAMRNLDSQRYVIGRDEVVACAENGRDGNASFERPCKAEAHHVELFRESERQEPERTKGILSLDWDTKVYDEDVCRDLYERVHKYFADPAHFNEGERVEVRDNRSLLLVHVLAKVTWEERNVGEQIVPEYQRRGLVFGLLAHHWKNAAWRILRFFLFRNEGPVVSGLSCECVRVQPIMCVGADEHTGAWTSRDVEKGELLVCSRTSTVLPMSHAITWTRSHCIAPNFKFSIGSGVKRVRGYIQVSSHGRVFER